MSFNPDLYSHSAHGLPPAHTVFKSSSGEFLVTSIEEKDGLITLTAKTAERFRIEQSALDARKGDERMWNDIFIKLAAKGSIYEVFGRNMRGEIELMWRGPASSKTDAEYQAFRSDARFGELLRKVTALYDAGNLTKWCSLIQSMGLSPKSTCVLERVSGIGSTAVQPPEIVTNKSGRSGPLGVMLLFLADYGVLSASLIIRKSDESIAHVELLETGEVNRHERRG